MRDATFALKRPSRVSARIFASVRANRPAIREARFARRVGIGSDLAYGQIRRRPSRVGAPHGANYDAPSRQGRGTPPSRVRLYERTYPPEGGERRSPKGIVRSYAFFVEKRGHIRFFYRSRPPAYIRGDGIDDVLLYICKISSII